MLELSMTIMIMILSLLSYYHYYRLTGFIVTNDYPHNQRNVINRFQIYRQKYLKFHFYFQISKFNPFCMYVYNSEDNCNNHKNNEGDNDQNDENDNDNINKT